MYRSYCLASYSSTRPVISIENIHIPAASLWMWRLFLSPLMRWHYSVHTEPLVNPVLINLGDCPQLARGFCLLGIRWVPFPLVVSIETVSLQNLCVQLGGSLFVIHLTTVHSCVHCGFSARPKRDNNNKQSLEKANVTIKAWAGDMLNVGSRPTQAPIPVSHQGKAHA